MLIQISDENVYAYFLSGSGSDSTLLTPDLLISDKSFCFSFKEDCRPLISKTWGQTKQDLRLYYDFIDVKVLEKKMMGSDRRECA